MLLFDSRLRAPARDPELPLKAEAARRESGPSTRELSGVTRQARTAVACPLDEGISIRARRVAVAPSKRSASGLLQQIDVHAAAHAAQALRAPLFRRDKQDGIAGLAPVAERVDRSRRPKRNDPATRFVRRLPKRAQQISRTLPGWLPKPPPHLASARRHRGNGRKAGGTTQASRRRSRAGWVSDPVSRVFPWLSASRPTPSVVVPRRFSRRATAPSTSLTSRHLKDGGHLTLRECRLAGVPCGWGATPPDRLRGACGKTGGEMPAPQPRRRHGLRPLSRKLADRSGSEPPCRPSCKQSSSPAASRANHSLKSPRRSRCALSEQWREPPAVKTAGARRVRRLHSIDAEHLGPRLQLSASRCSRPLAVRRHGRDLAPAPDCRPSAQAQSVEADSSYDLNARPR